MHRFVGTTGQGMGEMMTMYTKGTSYRSYKDPQLDYGDPAIQRLIVPLATVSTIGLCRTVKDNGELAQERTTSKRRRLLDLGYRKGLGMRVGSCFTSLKTRTNHHKPHTQPQSTVNS